MGKKKLRSLRNGEEESTPDRRGMEKEDTGLRAAAQEERQLRCRASYWLTVPSAVLCFFDHL